MFETQSGQIRLHKCRVGLNLHLGAAQQTSKHSMSMCTMWVLIAAMLAAVACNVNAQSDCESLCEGLDNIDGFDGATCAVGCGLYSPGSNVTADVDACVAACVMPGCDPSGCYLGPGSTLYDGPQVRLSCVNITDLFQGPAGPAGDNGLPGPSGSNGVDNQVIGPPGTVGDQGRGRKL